MQSEDTRKQDFEDRAITLLLDVFDIHDLNPSDSYHAAHCIARHEFGQVVPLLECPKTNQDIVNLSWYQLVVSGNKNEARRWAEKAQRSEWKAQMILGALEFEDGNNITRAQHVGSPDASAAMPNRVAMPMQRGVRHGSRMVHFGASPTRPP